MPLWVLTLGGIGIVIGLSTYGYRVMTTVGEKITQLTPSRGIAANTAATIVVLACSRMGLPVSTTHTLVGAILGVGLARGLASVDRSVEILVEHVARQRAHFAFIARERTAGPLAVRDAIRHEIDLCERELATDLARLPGTDAWSGEDLRILSNLIVHAMVSTAEALISAADRPALAQQIADTARTQLRMVIIGALQWRSRPSE